jgi:ABC-2 type transport system ATP-binding protein
MNPIIKVENVSMCFKTSNKKITNLKEFVIKKLKHEISYTEFWALKNISFQINRGDIFGILGLNGAGKSTILKIVSGILKPTKGNVHIEGRIAPLIELGAGFDPELTARENIFLNGAILGYDDKFIKNNFDEIVDFSELRDFLDTPIKNFSSGMYARLGFAVATVLTPDILIIDEILSVGDFKFQEKSQEKIQSMMENGTTVVIVSHSIEQIRKLCNKGIILEKGENIKCGDIDDVCDYYFEKYN